MSLSCERCSKSNEREDVNDAAPARPSSHARCRSHAHGNAWHSAWDAEQRGVAGLEPSIPFFLSEGGCDTRVLSDVAWPHSRCDSHPADFWRVPTAERKAIHSQSSASPLISSLFPPLGVKRFGWDTSTFVVLRQKNMDTEER